MDKIKEIKHKCFDGIIPPRETRKQLEIRIRNNFLIGLKIWQKKRILNFKYNYEKNKTSLSLLSFHC